MRILLYNSREYRVQGVYPSSFGFLVVFVDLLSISISERLSHKLHRISVSQVERNVNNKWWKIPINGTK